MRRAVEVKIEKRRDREKERRSDEATERRESLRRFVALSLLLSFSLSIFLSVSHSPLFTPHTLFASAHRRARLLGRKIRPDYARRTAPIAATAANARPSRRSRSDHTPVARHDRRRRVDRMGEGRRLRRSRRRDSLARRDCRRPATTRATGL